jgi:thioredoxin-like negative regulator of GroEL
LEFSEVIKEANSRLAAAETEMARPLIQDALTRWPNAGAVRVLNARLLDAEGRASDAVTAFRQAADALSDEIQLHTNNPSRAISLANPLVRWGDADAAAAALVLARERGIDVEVALRTERQIAQARRDFPAMRRAA